MTTTSKEADAVPVVVWVDDDDLMEERIEFYGKGAAFMQPGLRYDVALVRQSDHLSAIASLQQQLGECSGGYQTLEREVAALQAQIAELEARQVPIDMVLHCPACGLQHVDASEYERDLGMGNTKRTADAWTNPPHRSHLCQGCGHQWRPADVATNGVAAIKTKGENDSPIYAPSNPTTQPPEGR